MIWCCDITQNTRILYAEKCGRSLAIHNNIIISIYQAINESNFIIVGAFGEIKCKSAF